MSSEDARPLPKKDGSKTGVQLPGIDRLDTGVRPPGGAERALGRTHRDAAAEAKARLEVSRRERENMLEPFREAERQLGLHENARLDEDDDEESTEAGPENS